MAKAFDKILKMIDSTNLAIDLDRVKLDEIGQKVVRDFDIDWNSCDEWRRQNERAIILAKQVKEPKNFPWPGAANVKYPLVTSAAIQFASRAYPEIVQGNDVVRARIVGADPTGAKKARADRVSAFMSWQFTEEMGDWEEDTDRLLHILPIIGCLFRKSFFSSTERQNDSVLLLPDECVIHYKTKSMKSCRRITHVLKYYKNDVYERQSDRIWLDVDLGKPDDDQYIGDDDSPYTFLEQHRYLDLDEDGYQEPYIVTVHKSTSKVVRIKARYDSKSVELDSKQEKIVRIKPHQYFTKYSFIPNPDGGFLDIGFGTLLEPINESINTVLNELLDAGAAHNAGGGFIGRGVNLKGGQLLFGLNEWKTVESSGQALRDNIFPLPTRDPSQVLYLLLGTLIEAGKDISSVKNVLMGEKPGENVSAELFLALVDQGLKVFTGIYKRIYRSLRNEFKLHFWLNGMYLDPVRYYNVLDEQKTVNQSDFEQSDCDIYPVADPNLSLDIQRMARAQVLINGISFPGMKPMGVVKRWLEANKIPNIEEVFDPKQKMTPDPKAEEIYLKMGLARDKHNLEKQEIFANILKTLAQTKELYTRCVMNIANAEAAEAGPQLEAYKTYVQELGMMVKAQEAQFRQLTAPQEGTSNEQSGLVPAQESAGVSGIPGPVEGFG